MKSNRRTEALALLEDVLRDVENESVPTSALLMRCQRIARLLALEPDICMWIDLELQGYPPQNPDMKPNDSKQLVPIYRTLSLLSNWTVSGGVPYKYQSVLFHSITEPIGILESCDGPIPQEFSLFIQKGHPAVIAAELSPDRARGIVQAVRSRVNDFAATQRIALAFERSYEVIFDTLRQSLAKRLAQLDPSLLSLLEETVTKQERASSPIDFRDVLENLRTIIRSFTSLVLLDEMVPAGAEKPLDHETRKKTKLVCDWIRARLTGSYDTEAERIEIVLESLEKQQSVLIDAISKKGHEKMDEVRKHEVDHIILFSVLWLADFVTGLDNAGFYWPLVETK